MKALTKIFSDCKIQKNLPKMIVSRLGFSVFFCQGEQQDFICRSLNIF